MKEHLDLKLDFVPQSGGYFHDLTVYENFKAVSEINVKDKNLRDEKINLLISKFELEQCFDTRKQNFYLGDKKKN
jgi:lipopolysaccharide export system ATP-binding protein